jgi:toxin ParE1/3/4
MAWYEKQQEGLGNRFVGAVDQAIGKITTNPIGYPIFSGDNRRCNLERFPYALFFKLRADVVIVACVYGGRSPRLLKDRASGVIPFPEKPPEPT